MTPRARSAPAPRAPRPQRRSGAQRSPHTPSQPLAANLIAALALLALAIHLIANTRTSFGIHRDELLYLSMGRHLRLWRMDFPPFIALAANATRAVTGDALGSLRLLPALAHAALITLAAVTARELGGARWAQVLAALATLACPLFLAAGNLLQPVVFDQLWWTLALFALLRLITTSNARYWLLLGAALGIGLLTKFSIAFIGVPIVIAVFATRERRWLSTPWPWLALAIALIIGAPSIAGQIALGFPVQSQMAALQGSQLHRMTYGRFISGQILYGPAVILAAFGCASLLFGSLSRFRAIGIACVGAFVLLLASHGKAYYIGPIYPALFAAGATQLELFASDKTRTAVNALVTVLIVAFGLLVLPLVLPILPPATTARYASRLGVTRATETNRGEQLPLPQDFADMLGWREMAHTVANVYATIPAAERDQVVLIGANYGEAGALEFYGPRFSLPPVVSTAGSFWFFGPGKRPGNIVITLGVRKADLTPFFDDITEVARFDAPLMVPEERNVPILIARKPRTTLQAIWPRFAGRN